MMPKYECTSSLEALQGTEQIRSSVERGGAQNFNTTPLNIKLYHINLKSDRALT